MAIATLALLRGPGEPGPGCVTVRLGLPMTQIFDKKVATPGVEPAPTAKMVQIVRSTRIFFHKKFEKFNFGFAVCDLQVDFPASICTRY